MYSRYIPSKGAPSKKAPGRPEPAAPTASAVVPVSVPTSTPAAISAGPTSYSRYIPPKKAADAASKQHVHFDDDKDPIALEEPLRKKAKFSDETEEAPSDEDSPEPRKKDKTDKKDKKDKSKHKKERTDHQNDEGKKEKKKSRGSTNDVSAAEDDDEAIRQRHKSVFDKKAKSITAPDQVTEEDTVMPDADEDEPTGEIVAGTVDAHGLEPLPQPAPVVVEPKPEYQTLPGWLAEPIRVASNAKAAFTDFEVSPEIAGKLAEKGYNEAFAVQTAVIPLLLPSHDKAKQGDVLVHAATGSGKTMAYALPMIRDLSLGNRHNTKLRSLIVLPTRELVKQAEKVCNELASIFSLDGEHKRPKIGIAYGGQSLDKEEEMLLEKYQRLDRDAFRQRSKRLDERSKWGFADGHAYSSDDEERARILRDEDEIPIRSDHIIDYISKVDVLICTPGRLVEHIKKTPGFSLDNVRWLIVDEADKLLGQDFQQWLSIVMPKVHSNHRRNGRCHNKSNLAVVRKVVLSATMTRDVDTIAGLKLRRPRLVVLAGGNTDETHAVSGHTIPESLHESALRVEPDIKPLYLLDLLHHIIGTGKNGATKTSDNASSSSDSDSDDASSSGSNSSSDSDSESLSDVDKLQQGQKTAKHPSILIFTQSSENAPRLSRLLSLMSPSLVSVVAPLTSSKPSQRKKILRDFSAGKLWVLIASDLVARGIDLPSLDHVINYDVPPSIETYVHRVGRTARAGRHGQAWTLFTHSEARWFWRNGPASGLVSRGQREVERLRITEEKELAFESKKAQYEEAMDKLAAEAKHGKNRSWATTLENN